LFHILLTISCASSEPLSLPFDVVDLDDVLVVVGCADVEVVDGAVPEVGWRCLGAIARVVYGIGKLGGERGGIELPLTA
jgi:hypothetical protein